MKPSKNQEFIGIDLKLKFIFDDAKQYFFTEKYKNKQIMLLLTVSEHKLKALRRVQTSEGLYIRHISFVLYTSLFDPVT